MLTITVAQDGGDFASVSEAVLAVPYEAGRDPHRAGHLPGKAGLRKTGHHPAGRRVQIRPDSCGATAASCPTRTGGPPIPSAATRRFSAGRLRVED